LINEHGGAVAADLLRFYGMDIHGLTDGSLSPKYVLALLENLPADSALVTAMRGGADFHGWDRHSYLLADVFDAVQYLTHTFVSANAKKTPKSPEPYPRPGEAEKQEEKRRIPNPLTAALKGEDVVPEVGPGSIIPLPPQR
jgi:hypothetical protein